jgi:acyl-CoA synthetase (AMP-forming)/AMP-acid ligase II
MPRSSALPNSSTGTASYAPPAAAAAGAPTAVIGIAIAMLVLLPETWAAVRAAQADRLQTSMTLALVLLPAILLLAGFPVFLVLLSAATAFVVFVADVPATILHQAMFGGVESFALLSIPFFLFAGEVMVRGPQVMSGYWHRPEETAKTLQKGWLFTGDVAVMDEDGFLRIVDRKKDLVLVSGFNVYPNEVEDALAKMEAVLEAAVVPIPDAKTGEAVRAYIVKNPDFEGDLATEDILRHCKALLTDYKVPKSIIIRDELPKSPIGKILRKDLKAEVRAEFGL